MIRIHVRLYASICMNCHIIWSYVTRQFEMTGKWTRAINSHSCAVTIQWFLRGTHSSTLGSPPGTSIRGGSFTHSSTFCRWSLPIFSFSLSARTAPVKHRQTQTCHLWWLEKTSREFCRFVWSRTLNTVASGGRWLIICTIYSVLVDMISKLP